MKGIAYKKPFAVTSQQFADKNSADFLQMLGKALPCHVVSRNGAIVTVAFDINTQNKFNLPNVECPILESEYVKLPVKVGDRGVTMPASASIAAACGLGGISAPFFSQPANLTALVFVPIGNSGWSNPDPTASVVTSQDKSSVVKVGNGSITMTKGSSTITITDSSISIHANSVTITDSTGSWEFAAHIHDLGGGSTTGGVVP